VVADDAVESCTRTSLVGVRAIAPAATAGAARGLLRAGRSSHSGGLAMLAALERTKTLSGTSVPSVTTLLQPH
jgi:hypothetical protein